MGSENTDHLVPGKPGAMGPGKPGAMGFLLVATVSIFALVTHPKVESGLGGSCSLGSQGHQIKSV